MNKAQALQLKHMLLTSPRAIGKTHQMIEGIRNADKPVAVVTHSLPMATHIKVLCKNPNLTIITPNMLESLRGQHHHPIVLDHFVLEDLLHELEHAAREDERTKVLNEMIMYAQHLNKAI